MYLTDTEIRERLNIPERRWRPAVQHFELQGFPRVDPLIGKRYWPAVQAWLLKYYLEAEGRNQDTNESEDWDALKRKRRKQEAR